MTLIVHPELEQRSEEWYAVRRGLVTASAVGQLLTATLKVANNDSARGLTALLVTERITGWTEPTFISADMWRGIDHEPLARGYYAEHHAPVREVGFMTEDRWGFTIGYSPDGLVGDNGLIEIKCPRAKGHVQTILADKVPDAYMAQCQTALLVSGRDWLDYVSFSAGLPLFVKRVEPDPVWHNAIRDAVDAFECRAALMLAAYRNATRGLPATERVVELEMSL
jgi:putative phage-type endonuclease